MDSSNKLLEELSSSDLEEQESSPPKMADPFEVRMRFTIQLQHLNASVTSSQKAAQYALKYKDMDEDLHSCILEQLEKVCCDSTDSEKL
jgi:CTD kinase subunit gamma